MPVQATRPRRFCHRRRAQRAPHDPPIPQSPQSNRPAQSTANPRPEVKTHHTRQSTSHPRASLRGRPTQAGENGPTIAVNSKETRRRRHPRAPYTTKKRKLTAPDTAFSPTTAAFSEADAQQTSLVEARHSRNPALEQELSRLRNVVMKELAVIDALDGETAGSRVYVAQAEFVLEWEEKEQAQGRD